MMAGFIQLTEADGSPVVIPPEIREVRRIFLIYEVLGKPGTPIGDWSRFVTRMARRVKQRLGEFSRAAIWARNVVNTYDAICADPWVFHDVATQEPQH